MIRKFWKACVDSLDPDSILPRTSYNFLQEDFQCFSEHFLPNNER